jgi:hypothetical protein
MLKENPDIYEEEHHTYEEGHLAAKKLKQKYRLYVFMGGLLIA